LDWCDGTELEALARRSFALHAELAESLGADWGYRRLETFGGFMSLRPRQSGSNAAAEWLSREVVLNQRLGSDETTAQVHPAQFTAALMSAAEAKGASLRLGQVTGLIRGDRSGERIVGAEIDGEALHADEVVIAMGPWSQTAKEWLALPDIHGLKGHSLVFETGTAVPAQALFLECREETGAISSPEVFPRADGTTYVCAISSDSPVPPDPASVLPDPGAIPRLHKICERLSPVLAQSRVIASQACFRPITRDGLPMIGRVPSFKGALVATGHSVWGILNAPATGEALAELIVDGHSHSTDLAPFDPGRFARDHASAL
jgi:glycine/D-amino acid oxidase-like deaminating enzyme